MAPTGIRPDMAVEGRVVLSLQPGHLRPAGMRPNGRVRVFSGLLAVALNALLITGLVLALNKRAPSILQPSVIVNLVKIPPRPPVKLTIQPKLIPAKETQIALPKFDITPVQAPVRLTSTAQGLMASQASGAGNGGVATRKLVIPPPPAPAPNCETMAAYLERVRSEIKSYQVYPVNAQMRRLEGVVTLHFIANKSGHLLVYAVAGSTITRTLNNPDSEGHQQPVNMTFVEMAPNRWAYQAEYVGPPPSSDGGQAKPVTIGEGTVSFDADDTLTQINGAPPGSNEIKLVLPHYATGGADRFIMVNLGTMGIPLLNDETLRMIQQAQPLPAIPDCLKMQNLSAVMPFGYMLAR